jgi:pyridoxal phosphate enzyme (YggS family)
MKHSEIHGRVAQNFADVQGQVSDASGRAGGTDVTLVCVTKYAEDEWVRALLQVGATDLAENYLPRAAERFEALYSGGFRFCRHLIGPPQSRKVKFIPGNFDMVQAIDRIKIARLLDDCLASHEQQMDVLLQVNIAEEEQKHGVLPDAVEASIAWIIDNCSKLRLRGLMAVPPWPDAYANQLEFERGSRLYFRHMRELFDKMNRIFPAAKLDTLSLGMSQDYTWAIEEGATAVRVGSALYAGLS